MTIQRSKSAPFPISSSQVANSREPQYVNANIIRSKSFLINSPTASSIYSLSPRVEKGDPFGLSDFYSAAHLEGVEWNWLRCREVDTESISSSSSSFEEISAPSTPGGVIFSMVDDELARDTIKAEDKLGILSFANIFSTTTLSSEDRLFSPYTHDEVADNDSLYDALRKRRLTENSHRVCGSTCGDLFSPKTEKEEGDTSELSWLDGVCQVLGLC